MMSDRDKQQKKQQIEELTSQFVNLLIFIWLAKILLHASIFIEDPIAILAYPSDSSSFYLAIVATVLLLVIKFKRKQMDMLVFLDAFVHVFLVASFVYDFIQLIWNDNTYALGPLMLVAGLLLLFVFIRGRFPTATVILMIGVLWSFGLMVLAWTQAFVTVFGYMMEPWFTGIVLFVSITIFIYRKKGL